MDKLLTRNRKPFAHSFKVECIVYSKLVHYGEYWEDRTAILDPVWNRDAYTIEFRCRQYVFQKYFGFTENVISVLSIVAFPTADG